MDEVVSLIIKETAMAKKIKITDVWNLCKSLGMVKVTTRYHDAGRVVSYKLLDSVGMQLAEVTAEVDDDTGCVVASTGRKNWSLTDDKVWVSFEKALENLVHGLQDRLQAVTPDDKTIWKWLDSHMVVYKEQTKEGYVQYTANARSILLVSNEFNLCWVPLVNADGPSEVAGSSTANLGEIGFTVATFIEWLEANGINRKKREKKSARISYSAYD